MWESQRGLGGRVRGLTVGALGLGVPWGSCTGELGPHHLQQVRSLGPSTAPGESGALAGRPQARAHHPS